MKSTCTRMLLRASLMLMIVPSFAWPAEHGSSSSSQPYIAIVEKGSPDHPRNSEGGIVELRDGSWLQVWCEWFSSPGMGEDLSPSHLVAAVSRDEGKTWQPARVGGKKCWRPQCDAGQYHSPR